MSLRIALTGGIACGKSLAARFLNEFGVETIDADDIAHELIPDPAERRRIAAEVFADAAKRRALEARLHPLVKARIDAFLSSLTSSHLTSLTPLTSLTSKSPSQAIRLAVIPLLFEARWDGDFDIICTVRSDREVQIARMTGARGYSRGEAEARLAAQMPVEEKARKSHYVINNNGSVDELKLEVERFVSWLKNLTCSQTR